MSTFTSQQWKIQALKLITTGQTSADETTEIINALWRSEDIPLFGARVIKELEKSEKEYGH